MEKILYVDDELMNLQLFELNFRDNYIVFTTPFPMDAQGIIEKEGIKVIITDYKMPLLNGMQLIDKVKTAFPNVICLILSGYLESEVVTDKTKVFSYIMKPYNKATLTACLENAFSQYSDILTER